MLNAIEQVNAETVFILPNNKNIILAATQAQSLVEDKNVVIIPTTTVPQGISAIIGFDPEADVESNEESMNHRMRQDWRSNLCGQRYIHQWNCDQD